MVSAARRQIIGGGGGGAPINKSRRRRRSQIVGGGGAARPAHSSSSNAVSCNIWLNFNRGMSAMLGNYYNGPSLSNKQVKTVQKTIYIGQRICRDSRNRSLNVITELLLTDHIMLF